MAGERTKIVTKTDSEKEEELIELLPGLFYTIYKGRLHLRDFEGLALEGYDPKELAEVSLRCEKAMEEEVLSDTLYWIMMDTPIGLLNTQVAQWLTQNFDIKLKSRPQSRGE